MSLENEPIIEESHLYAESIYGSESREGLVRISYGLDFELSLTPDEARHFAMSLLQSADAAESDHFIMEWLEKRIGVPEFQKRVEVLRDFRVLRDQLRRGEKIDFRKGEKHG